MAKQKLRQFNKLEEQFVGHCEGLELITWAKAIEFGKLNKLSQEQIKALHRLRFNY
jgi:hypothetical protein